MNHDIQTLMDKAKIDILASPDTAFISSVLFSLQLKVDASLPTAAVDGVKMYINPTFFKSLSEPERVFLLLHEVWHCCLEHLFRAKGKDFRLYNVAADYVINLMLVEQGYTMIEGGLLDRRFKGMSTEEVYSILEAENSQEQPDFDDVLEPSPEASEELQEELKEILVKAANVAEQVGQWDSVGSTIKARVDEIVNPKLDWRTILWNHMTARTNEDYSWSRPNKLFFPELYLPSLQSEGMGELVLFLDASGSTGPQFEDIVNEARSLQASLNPEKITFITFNHNLLDTWSFNRDEYITDMAFRRGGGTKLQPVSDWIKEHKPECSIILTDGGFNKVTFPSDTDLIWIIYSNPSFQYTQGRIVHYE